MKKLGFGFMRLPLTDPADQTSIDMAQTMQMVDSFLQQGFTYFDTAYRYHDGTSEGALRTALVQRYPRDAFQIASKMPSYLIESEADFPRIFAHQKQLCGVEFFDYYLMHCLNAKLYATVQQFGGFDYLRACKAAGEIRKLGFSFHDNAALLDKILTEQPDMDFVQLQINYLDWEDADIQARLCYETARRHGVPIIVMEPVKGGALANLPPAAAAMLRQGSKGASEASFAVRYAASLPGVFMVLSGMSNLAQLQDNTGYMRDFVPLSEAEGQLLHKVADELRRSIAVPCTGCSYCTETCPQGIAIPKVFGIYNRFSSFGLAAEKQSYAALGAKASDCIACGVCEGLCPQKIQIVQALQQAAAALE